MYSSKNHDILVGTHVDDCIIAAFQEPLRKLVSHLRNTFGQDSVSVTMFEQNKPTLFLGVN